MHPAAIGTVVLGVTSNKKATLVGAFAQAEYLTARLFSFDVDARRLVQLVLHQLAVLVARLPTSLQHFLKKRLGVANATQILFEAVPRSKGAKRDFDPTEFVLRQRYSPV